MPQKPDPMEFEEFKSLAEEELMVINSGAAEITNQLREYETEAWAGWNERVEGSGFAKGILQLMKTSRTYKGSIRARNFTNRVLVLINMVTAAGAAIIQYYDIPLFRTPSDPVEFGAMYIIANALFAYGSINNHIKAKRSKQEIMDYIEPENFDEAVDWLGEQYKKIHSRYRHFNFWKPPAT